MAKFRKKPVVVEAEQFIADRHPRDWPEGVHTNSEFDYAIYDFVQSCNVQVKDHDWIITGIKGETYPCANDVFERSYEAVTE